MENQTTATKGEKNVNLEANQATTDAQQGNQTPPAPAVNEPGKVKTFFSKAGNAVKKALPYVGAAVAGAAVTAGAIVVALAKGEDSGGVPALEKDDETIPVDDFIDGEAEFVDDSVE